MRHDTDGRLAGVQIHGEARLVGIAEPQVLVVKRAHRHAGQDRRAQQRHAEDTDHAADRGALVCAVGAHLVLLELAVGIEDQDADGIPVGDAGILQRSCGGVRCALIREDSEYELPVGHRSAPSVG